MGEYSGSGLEYEMKVMKTNGNKDIDISQKDIRNHQGLEVGQEFILTGELTRAVLEKNLEMLKTKMQEIVFFATFEMVAINVLNLSLWDAAGVQHVVGPIVKLNKELQERERFPTAMIGSKESKVFSMVRDSYPTENDTPVLPWYESTKAYLSSCGLR